MTISEGNDDADDVVDTEGVLKDVVPPISKTPLFQAIHAARYQRQALIREIESSTGNKVISYVAGIAAPVDREDVVCFVDLLHNISRGQDIDLILHTGGGDIDAAEKLMTMVRKKTSTGQVRVIVPDYAKSAGTLMALGADRIIMSDTSELGPIDPQVIRADRNGNRMRHSVKNYLDAYNQHQDALKKNPNDLAAQMMLNKLDPETVQLFTSIMKRAREFAEKQLHRGMMKEVGNWSQAVSALLDNSQFPTHGQPISWEDASDPKIGLTVDYLDPNDELWQKLWHLYCLQALAVRDKQKLFESEIASICIDSRAV
ncbi:hypothetical protein M6B22_07095 [Jatrophihabitans cynanchi]|uniref:Serine dehydrogenase proteinase n=1 Tax=Jatrophihabitans cynanchi TaxID=2944128 RepID=A0ABY7K0Z3_9ACTN|nr:hypothetical protein [Jatrophihabitans sp. SB3-54]WAX58523.1 hypothetical protein M6B22_07095 [Jatrophihabitans sp. SB3-54]